MIGFDGCCRVAAMGESRCRAGELSESCVSGRASWGDGEFAERARRAVAGVSTAARSARCGDGGAAAVFVGAAAAVIHVSPLSYSNTFKKSAQLGHRISGTR